MVSGSLPFPGMSFIHALLMVEAVLAIPVYLRALLVLVPLFQRLGPMLRVVANMAAEVSACRTVTTI